MSCKSKLKNDEKGFTAEQFRPPECEPRSEHGA